MSGNNDNREPKLLPAMLQGEKRDITWPCAPALNAGESVASQVVSCVRDRGAADSTPSARIATPAQVIGTDVVQRFSADVGDVWYVISCEVTTTSGRELIGQGLLYVRPL